MPVHGHAGASDAFMTQVPNNPETAGHPQALSRRAALLLLAIGLTSIGSPPRLRETRLPPDEIVIIDGWMLRADDLERMRRGVG